MFLRQLEALRNESFGTLYLPQSQDGYLAENINVGKIEIREAIDKSLLGNLSRVYILFHLFAKTGIQRYLDRAFQLANLGQAIAIDVGFQELWWAFYTTIALLKEYERNSLWTLLRPLKANYFSDLVDKYIHSAFLRQPEPVINLWRSQTHTIPHILSEGSFCLKMPTSSGKTGIAEITILKFLLDTEYDPSKKCLYVAPYRALAVEVERALSQRFDPLGARVSQLYGSYDLSPTEEKLIDEARILVGTPEKIDAFLRYSEEIGGQVGLIIIDEGHIIDAGDRGIRYELFVHRLVRRYERNGIRILFMSAVMPNVEQFAKWITGKDYGEGIIQSTWRATEQQIGIINWNGYRARVDYLYRDLVALNQDLFISNLFTAFDSDELSEAKTRKQKFPLKTVKKGTLAAMATLKLLSEGTILVFVGKKASVSSVAKAFIEVLELHQTLDIYFDRPVTVFPQRNDADSQARLEKCIAFAEASTGKDSIVVRALKNGFVIHHGDIPRALRVELEDLVRDGIINVIIATSTLAQGVNLPIRNIIFHSTDKDDNVPLSSREFWNICGRAGRANKETKGSIYLLVDGTQTTKKTKLNGTERIWNRNPEQEARDFLEGYVTKAKTTSELDEIVSAVRSFLSTLVKNWREYLFSVNKNENQLSELLEVVGNIQEPEWLDERAKRELRALDQQSLAFSEEEKLTEDLSIEQVSTIFADSILSIQLQADTGIQGFDQEEVLSLVMFRIKHIVIQCGTERRRKRFYKMGLSPKDCLSLDNRKLEIQEYLAQANEYMSWDDDTRTDYLVQLCDNYLIELDGVSKSTDEEIPDCWSVILKHWLLGKTADEISQLPDLELPQDWDSNSTMKISTLVDNLCEFQLTWGLNALTALFDEEDDFIIPEIIKYFASLLRFGVHCPIAATFLVSGLGFSNRRASLALTKHYIGVIEPSHILSWLRSRTKEVVEAYIDDDTMSDPILEFMAHLQASHETKSKVSPEVHRLRLSDLADIIGLEPDTSIECLAINEDIHLFNGEKLSFLGSIKLSNAALSAQVRNHTAKVVISRVDKFADYGEIYVRVG